MRPILRPGTHVLQPRRRRAAGRARPAAPRWCSPTPPPVRDALRLLGSRPTSPTHADAGVARPARRARPARSTSERSCRRRRAPRCAAPPTAALARSAGLGRRRGARHRAVGGAPRPHLRARRRAPGSAATCWRCCADAGLRALPGPVRPPDCGVLVGVGEPDRELLDAWTRAGTPYLLVRLTEGRAVVGPFVVPGTTACLRCLDAHHTDADPAWPLLVRQYAAASLARPGRRRPRAGRPAARRARARPGRPATSRRTSTAAGPRPGPRPSRCTPARTRSRARPGCGTRRAAAPGTDRSAAAPTGPLVGPVGTMGSWAPHVQARRAPTRTGNPHDRAPTQGRARAPHGSRRCRWASPGRTRRRHGPADRRGHRRRRDDRRAAAHRRAALQDARRPQGRRDEDGPGAVHPGVGAPRGARGALPQAADQAAGLRSPDVGDAPCTTCWPRELGTGWRKQLVEFDDDPAAAASIGQVHRGRWADGREVAVKVQYPGAGEALMSDLRQLSRVARTVGGDGPGHRHQAADRRAPGPGRRGARLPPRGRGPARRSPWRSATTPTSWSPTSSRTPTRCWSRSGSTSHRVAGPADRRGHPGGAQPLRRPLRPLPVRGARPGRACCTPTRTPATSACCPPRTARWAGSASSTTARSPGCPRRACRARWAR